MGRPLGKFRNSVVLVAVGHDGTGEGKLVGWAGPDHARACRLQEEFQTLEYNKPMKFLTGVFLKFPSVLKDHSNYQRSGNGVGESRIGAQRPSKWLVQ